MEAIAFLGEARRLDVLIACTRAELERLDSMVHSVTANMGGERVASGKPAGDSMGDSVARILDLRESFAADLKRYAEQLERVREVIGQVGNPLLVGVLYRRYILFQTWERVAVDMDVSYRWVFELNERGVSEVQAILDGKSALKCTAPR